MALPPPPQPAVSRNSSARQPARVTVELDESGRGVGDCRILTAMRGWLNCLRRCRRQRRALDCCGRVRRPSAWLPDVLDSHTAQKKRSAAEASRPEPFAGGREAGVETGAVTPKLRIRRRGPRTRPLSGLARVRLARRAGAIASRVHLTPQAAAAPSAPTGAPPWPLPTDALGHRRSPAWPRS